MVFYSENQGASYAAKAVMPQSASSTQNMNILHLKTQASDTWHTVGPIEKMHRQNPRCENGRNQRPVLLGHRSTMVGTLQNGSGIPTALHV